MCEQGDASPKSGNDVQGGISYEIATLLTPLPRLSGKLKGGTAIRKWSRRSLTATT